jgi:hypothetical protein
LINTDASAKGANDHIIAGISQLGMVNHEIRRGLEWENNFIGREKDKFDREKV